MAYYTSPQGVPNGAFVTGPAGGSLGGGFAGAAGGSGAVAMSPVGGSPGGGFVGAAGGSGAGAMSPAAISAAGKGSPSASSWYGGAVSPGMMTNDGVKVAVAGGVASPGVGVGVGVAAAGGGCCTGTVGCGGVETGSLAFVGQGRGEWITETTYKYVGVGAGDLTVVTARRAIWPWLLALGLLVAILLAILLAPLRVGTTTRINSRIPDDPPEIRRCIFWGDPHVVTFDDARPSFYGEGEYWIVKNPTVKIQGRYEGTKYTFGLASTRSVAISGQFINDNKIEIEPMQHEYGGAIRVNGQVVLREYGSVSVGGARITFNNQGDLVDDATSKWDKNVVHVDLPGNIHMEVFRWANYLDMKIDMPPLEGGQDGSCGNFNGNPDDDSTQEIFNRIGSRIQPLDSLFTTPHTHVDFSDQMDKMLAKSCPNEVKEIARQHCTKEFGNEVGLQILRGCMFDHCFGSNEHALQVAKTYASLEDLRAAGLAD